MYNRIGKKLFTKFLVWSSRFEKPAEMIHYRSIVGRARRFLVYIPDSAEARRINYIRERLKECFPGAYTEYMVVETEAPGNQEVIRSSVPNDQMTVVKKDDIGFWGLMKKPILERLKDKQFDLVLDFSSTFDVSLAHAFRASGAPVIAGLFIGKESELFHNLLIKTGGNDSFDPVLFDCLSQLRM